MDSVNVSEVIENSRLGRLQLALLIVGSLCVVMDGFDVQAMGYVAPSIIGTFHISKSEFGAIFSAGFLGMMLGAIGLGIIADRIGKRPVVIGATLALTLFLAATANASTTEQFVTLRFFTGICMGTFIPSIVALVGEYGPRRMKVTLMMIVASGFVAGGAVGGFIAANLIPAFGWRSVFYTASGTALIIGLSMFVILPESLQYLVLKGRSRSTIVKLLTSIDSRLSITSATRFVVREKNETAPPVGGLFKEQRTGGTLLLWVANFMNMLCIYFFANWLPTITHELGYSISLAAYAGTSFWVGGVVGCFVLGWLIDRIGFGAVLTVSYLVAAICVWSIGQSTGSVALTMIAITGAGFCLLGGPPVLNALAASFYPLPTRAGGMGWAQGLGRLGSIIGPTIGGELLQRNWSADRLFVTAVIPICVALLASLGFWIFRIPERKPVLRSAPPADAQEVRLL